VAGELHWDMVKLVRGLWGSRRCCGDGSRVHRSWKRAAVVDDGKGGVAGQFIGRGRSG